MTSRYLAILPALPQVEVYTLPVNVIVSKLKPDMVIYNRQENSIHLFELTVPFETNINKAHDIKHKKYLDLVSEIADNEFICDHTCFEVGLSGLITPENVGHITKIFSFVGAKPKDTFLGNSTNWLSCKATRSGIQDRSRPGAPKICQ